MSEVRNIIAKLGKKWVRIARPDFENVVETVRTSQQMYIDALRECGYEGPLLNCAGDCCDDVCAEEGAECDIVLPSGTVICKNPIRVLLDACPPAES